MSAIPTSVRRSRDNEVAAAIERHTQKLAERRNSTQSQNNNDARIQSTHVPYSTVARPNGINPVARPVATTRRDQNVEDVMSYL